MALYTQKAIMRAFGEMLEEMPFDKITVPGVRVMELDSSTRELASSSGTCSRTTAGR